MRPLFTMIYAAHIAFNEGEKWDSNDGCHVSVLPNHSCAGVCMCVCGWIFFHTKSSRSQTNRLRLSSIKVFINNRSRCKVASTHMRSKHFITCATLTVIGVQHLCKRFQNLPLTAFSLLPTICFATNAAILLGCFLLQRVKFVWTLRLFSLPKR